MSDDKKQLSRGDTAFCMDRKESIKFKLMPEGHIRAYDCRTMSGISEAHVYPPMCVRPRCLQKETT